jgi:hypothetical protein
MGTPAESPPELSFGVDETPESSVMDLDNNVCTCLWIMSR